MLPDTIDIENSIYEPTPSLTYKLNKNTTRIMGKIDEREAVAQAIEKILTTTKYAYVIYNWMYGNDLETLIGQPYDYVIAEISRVATEALLQDDRILAVNNFVFTKISVDSVNIVFTVETIFGDINYESEVTI